MLMDRPSAIPWPPLIFVVAIVAALLMGSFYSLPWLPVTISDGLFAVGIMMVVGGFAFDIYSLRTLKKHKTTISPIKGAKNLVTSGPFALSRNPIYLGNTVITLGLGIATANPWFFIFAIIGAMAVNYLQILPEEKHLAHRFGKQWRVYAKKVRRWI
jgi:protein-S-isoprenylcysteine O-methyltransferase Ste14